MAFYGRVNELEQYTRRNNIHIMGLPETEAKEEAYTSAGMVVSRLNETMWVNIHRNDIDITQ